MPPVLAHPGPFTLSTPPIRCNFNITRTQIQPFPYHPSIQQRCTCSGTNLCASNGCCSSPAVASSATCEPGGSSGNRITGASASDATFLPQPQEASTIASPTDGRFGRRTEIRGTL
ncbi:hypothetical protein BCR44DRAFT_1444774, partial [Catenaria anguillulae PL171]